MPGVAVVSVPVTDQDRAAAFYTTYLGFRVVEDQAMGPDMRWVQLAAGDESTTITLTTWFDTMSAGTVQGLVIDVEDPDGCRAAIAESGVECTECADEPWGRYFMCADPDGNSLVVSRTTARRG